MKCFRIEVTNVYTEDNLISPCPLCSCNKCDLLIRQHSDHRARVYSMRCCICGLTGPWAGSEQEAKAKYKALHKQSNQKEAYHA